MKQIHVFRPVNGDYTNGDPAVNALGCSGHWFTVRENVPSRYRGHYLVAAGWYEHGTRFLSVDQKSGQISQVGYFQPIRGSASAAYWIDNTDYVYVVDYQRGIDILQFDPAAAPPTAAATRASWLAKLHTVDALSHGRLNFGIGAGWFEHEYRAYGFPYPDRGERLRRLHEAVQIILAMWTQDEATFEGQYYQVRGAINQPKGVQKPHIPLLIGGGGEKVTLRMVAQYGDACNVGGDIATIKHKFAVLKRHCDELGRDYNSIRRTILIDDCAIADTEEAAIAKLTPEDRNNLDEFRQEALVGTPAMIRQRLAEYEEAGVQEIIIRFVDATKLESIRLFARECMDVH